MSHEVVFAVPGDLATPTGGYAYDRRIIAELEALGWRVHVLDLGSAFPRPGPAALEEARRRLEAVLPGRRIVIDGLALGVLPEAAISLATTHKPIGLIHHPLAFEAGLSPSEASALRLSERAALAPMRHVIVTSPSTARLLVADYGVPTERITVAMPGVDRAPRRDRQASETISLLSVGSLVPRKGYDILLEALGRVTDFPWRLTIAGDRSRNPETAAAIEAGIAAMNLGARVTLAGAVSEERLAEFYGEADLFVLASRFEGYGMAFADALAHAVPVIGTTAGAIAETVPAEAGVLVSPDDVAAFAEALRRVIGDGEERRRLAAGAQAAAARLPTWAQAAQAFAAALEAVR